MIGGLDRGGWGEVHESALHRGVVRGHPVAVVRIVTTLDLVDEVPYRQSMILCSAEHQGLLALINARDGDKSSQDHEIRPE